MKNLILVALVFLLLVSASDAKIEFNNLQELVDGYNANIEKAPQFITNLLGSETLDFTVPLKNGTKLRWGLKMQDAKIINSSPGGIENPSIVVYATEEAIDNVLAAQDTLAAFDKAKQEGQISIDGMNTLSRLKIMAAFAKPDFIKYFFGIFSQDY